MQATEVEPGDHGEDDGGADGMYHQGGFEGGDAHPNEHDRTTKCPPEQAQGENYGYLFGSELSHIDHHIMKISTQERDQTEVRAGARKTVP